MRDSDCWAELSDALVRGAHHELNNRVAALSGVEQVIASGGELTPSLREALAGEIGRLRATVERLGRIPSSVPAPERPMRLQDALGTALELIALHPSARDARFEVPAHDDLPPVRADAAAVQRSLLLMLASAARSAGDGPVLAECSADHARVRVRIHAPAAQAPLPGAEREEAERLAIASWLRPSAGEVDRWSAPASYTISLPAMVRQPAP